MFSTEFYSWVYIIGNRTCFAVRSDAGISYIVVFDADDGVIYTSLIGEWK